MTREIADENIADPIRQMASIIFKNFIINRTKVGHQKHADSMLFQDQIYENFWINMETEFKGNMKMALLATLATPKAVVRNQIANILAAIASIEIPRKEWDDLIPSLCANSTSEELNIKLASLTTLGYICEELDPSDLTDQVKNNILMALTMNISNTEPHEPTRLAIRALLFSIPYTRPNFQVQNERDFIMEKIFMACVSPQNEI